MQSSASSSASNIDENYAVKFDYKDFLKKAPNLPGIYQMFSDKDVLLYVGKAGNLKKRLASYFRQSGLSIKNSSLMQQVVRIDVIATRTETEALILENNLIKKHHPKYNILLRDDKSYPYIHVSGEDYARLKFHRGSRAGSGLYFGPYPSARTVKETLDLLQRVFLIRNCENSVFKNRSRPCLQYQIGRCTAPCVDLVTKDEYKLQIDDAISFLQGKNEELLRRLETKMQTAAKEQAFESAIQYRNQLQNLRKVLEKQYISNSNVAGIDNVDVIACGIDGSNCVIQVFYYRNGHSLGSQVYLPKTKSFHDIGSILQAFLEQIYFDKKPPKEIILSHKIDNQNLLDEFFISKFSQKVNWLYHPKQPKSQWLELAKSNVELTLINKRNQAEKLENQFALLTQILIENSFDKAIDKNYSVKTMACIDVSHTMGEATIASYVVFDINGAKKSDYRRYNIENITLGDDYAAMAQVITRRFKSHAENANNINVASDEKTEKSEKEGTLPDVLFIDGGKGQFTVVENCLKELNINNMLLVGIAKGVERKAGLERLYIGSSANEVKLAENNPALHLIQQIRDESHRFAIIGHRKKRDKQRLQSELKEVEGIGNKRRQALLTHFAGIKGVKIASVEELKQVTGISNDMAKKIYAYFHE